MATAPAPGPSAAGVTTPSGFTIHPMALEHLPGVLAVQNLCYPAHYREAAATFKQRVRTHPGGCFVAADAATGVIIGYVQAFAWPGDAALPVCDIDPAAFARAVDVARAAGPGSRGTVFHVHDVACRAPGRGVGGALMGAALEHARAAGHARAQLIAVMGMEAVWGRPRFGFAAGRHADAAGLAGYGCDGGAPAVFMTRALPGAAEGAGGAELGPGRGPTTAAAAGVLEIESDRISTSALSSVVASPYRRGYDAISTAL